VVKGAAGLRLAGLEATLSTLKLALSSMVLMALASARLVMSRRPIFLPS
jgi:hypothetical protein